MGIHTGEPLATGEGYAGLDVHRAARIAAAGHGGQVLVSQTTRDLVDEDLPPQLTLRDLGDHRLKDLTRPQRIYQLLGEGLDDDFPPLATLDNRPTNLPPQATPLIGRERELGEITATLRRAEVRLLTLTGPGGAGKTRLALQAAADMLDEFPDGVFFIALAPIAEETSVLPTIAQTLGVKEGPGRSLSEAVREFLGERRLLLVLDNFEHVVDAASDLIELVLSTPFVKALVASRAPLRVSAEREYPVLQLTDADAVALFTERAQAIKPDFQIDGETPAVADICRRLDGLPLAIELAAARAKVLSPSALLARLEQRLPVLTGGARDLPDRQRTLRDTIAWSYDLLDDSEKEAFMRLGVFVGGFSLEAAEEVCAANLDAVVALVEKSLVRQDERRLVMLETIREYALERLEESAVGRETRQRHAEYFLREAELRGGTGEAVAGRGDAFAWWKRELDNASVAMEWFRESGDEEQELRLIAAAANYWRAAGVFSEYGPLIEDAVQRCSAAPPQLRATAISHAAGFAGAGGITCEPKRSPTNAWRSPGRSITGTALSTVSSTLRSSSSTPIAKTRPGRTIVRRKN
jgi:predicted ATPase